MYYTYSTGLQQRHFCYWVFYIEGSG